MRKGASRSPTAAKGAVAYVMQIITSSNDPMWRDASHRRQTCWCRHLFLPHCNFFRSCQRATLSMIGGLRTLVFPHCNFFRDARKNVRPHHSEERSPAPAVKCARQMQARVRWFNERQAEVLLSKPSQLSRALFFFGLVHL